jgi:hypothetical protein
MLQRLQRPHVLRLGDRSLTTWQALQADGLVDILSKASCTSLSHGFTMASPWLHHGFTMASP